MKILFFLESELEQVKRRTLSLRNISDERNLRQSQIICYVAVLKVFNTFNTFSFNTFDTTM